jgi:hypothetical protein
MAHKNQNRDLWREARLRTQKESKPGFWANLLFKVQTVSLRGRPVVQSILPTAIAQRNDVVWFPDLNKYNPYSIKPYLDAGCKAIMGRIGGPASWTMDNWNYQLDATWKPLMEEADKYGVLGQVIGYWVHNAFEYRTLDAAGNTIQTNQIDRMTSGGYMPKALCLDHEISKCWLGTGAEFPLTAWNAIESLRVNAANIQKKFNKKTMPVYSAIWYMHQTAEYWDYHYNHFYNSNRPVDEGGVGITRPLMLAWYPGVKSTVYTSMTDVANDLVIPSSDQIGKYLYCGFQGNSWQFTDRLNIGGKTCDFNVSLDPSGTFFDVFGLAKPGVVPPTPDPIPDPIPTPDVDLTPILNRLTAIESDVDKIQGWILSGQNL